MRGISIIAMALLAAPAAAGAQEQAALPDWLAGCWHTGSGERWTEECWMPPRAGIMLGAGRSGTGDKLRTWEAMQITTEAGGGLAFWGAPDGAKRTRFERRAGGEPGLSFYNMENDYPQRIRYWREGESLNAEIAMADGSKPMRWSYKRMAT